MIGPILNFFDFIEKKHGESCDAFSLFYLFLFIIVPYFLFSFLKRKNDFEFEK